MRIIFYYPHNRLGRKDGAEFEARALDCLRYWSGSGDVETYALPKGSDAFKRAFVSAALLKYADATVDRIAIFSHGTANWCDAGITTQSCSAVAAEMRRITTPDARIGLFCCSCGATATGLAAVLAMHTGRQVLAHATSGHTTRNPYQYWFSGSQRTAAFPSDKPGWREWVKQLQVEKNRPFEILDGIEAMG